MRRGPSNEEVDLGEVDDQTVIAVFGGLYQRGKHGRGRRDIEATAQFEDARSIDDVDVQRKVFVGTVIDTVLLARDPVRVRAGRDGTCVLRVCWGGWTRTIACQIQSLVPYQLGDAPSVPGARRRDQPSFDGTSNRPFRPRVSPRRAARDPRSR